MRQQDTDRQCADRGLMALQAPPCGPAAPVAVATGLPDGPSLRSGSGPPPGRLPPAHDQHPHPHPTGHHHRPDDPNQGPAHRTRHYESDTGARVLIGQRIDGSVHVFDEPTSNGTGITYEVERDLESKAALDALITDYLAKAKRIGYAPMHGWF